MADGGEGTLKKFINYNSGKIKKTKFKNALGQDVSVEIGEFENNKEKCGIFETFQTAGFGYKQPKKYKQYSSHFFLWNWHYFKKNN